MAAPMWRSAVEDYIVGLSDNSLGDIVSDLVKKNVTLLEVVESMGSSLTSPEASVRAQGVRLLADIAHGLPTQTLSDKEADILVLYMVEKLRDHHSIQPHALYGLLALSCCSSLPEGAAEKICRTVFGEVYNQSLAQRDRKTVYQILLNFLKYKPIELKKMEGEFVHGFIQAMDMEKDPRNLVVAFQCVQVTCQQLSLGVFVEEMFEVFSCYFPVDFSPPPGDVFGVKKEDLVLGLERCMSATHKFAPFCLPLLLEKISSDLTTAKIESFKALVSCADVYGASGLQEFLGSFFSAIKREVFSSGDRNIEDAALNALTAIVKTLSNDVNEKGSISSLDGFLDDILKDCVGALREPGLRVFAPTARLLQAMAGSSDPAFCKIVHGVMPLLLQQFESHTQVTERSAILSVVQNIVKLSNNFTFSKDVDNPLSQYKEQVFTLSCQLLTSSVTELRHYGVTCLTAVSSARLLGSVDTELMADHLTSIVLTDTDSSVRASGEDGLACLGSSSPAVIIDRVVPALVNRLQPGTAPMEVDGQKPSCCNHISCLQILVSIATHDQIILKIVPEFITYLKSLCKEPSCSEGLEGAVAVSQCLSCVLEKNMKSGPVVQHYLSMTAPELLDLTVHHALLPHPPSVLHSQTVITNIAKTLRILMTQLSQSESRQLSSDVVALFLQGKLLPYMKQSIGLSEKSFQPLSVSSSTVKTQLVCILTAVVCSLPKQVQLTEESELLERLTDISLKSSHEFTCASAAKCIGGLVNKIAEEQELTSVASALKARLSELLESQSSQPEKRAALVTLIWLTKALVLRGHVLASDLANQMVTRLEEGELGGVAADGFRVLLSECEEVMTLSQHAHVRLMYRQRIFIENLPRLVQGFNTTQPEYKKHYLMALSHLVTFVPKQVLLTEADTLLPLLVHSLLCEETELQLATLTTLCSLITDAPELISKHVDSLVPQLLKLSCNAQKMELRIAGLKCLSSLTTLPPHITLPHKTRVVRALEPALDDHKRLVRREAVSARGEWFLLGEPIKS